MFVGEKTTTSYSVIAPEIRPTNAGMGIVVKYFLEYKAPLMLQRRGVREVQMTAEREAFGHLGFIGTFASFLQR